VTPALVVDAHVHLLRWAGEDSTLLLLESARRNGVSRLLCSSLGLERYDNPITPDGMLAANDYVLRELEAHPAELRGLCYACPAFLDESLREIERCVARGPMVGVKLWIDAKASDPRAVEIARVASGLGVPVLQHAFYKTTGNYPAESTPADVAALAAAVPAARIHMAHLWGCGWRGIADVAPYPNVWVDTSGSDPESGLLEYGLRELGHERLLFGSDAPGRGFAVQLGKILGTAMEESWRAAILGENVNRLYGLEAA
jgi:predicted TIM-barrel fold metal-dependent hydrolase